MSVGYKLYREIRDMAPDDWSSGELVVALMIADDARDDTRRSWIPLPLLCQRTRLKPSTVRELLGKLGARGYEFRVIHGYGRDGRPVFATKGHAVDYEVPDMLKGDGIPAPLRLASPVDNSAKGDGIPAPIATPGEPKGDGNPAIGDGEPAPMDAQRRRYSVTPPLKEHQPSEKKPSTEEPLVAFSNVEGSGACGKPDIDIAASNGHKPTSLERAAWLAITARQETP